MAPWCPACRSFQPTWQSFADIWSKDLEISVGIIDVTESPGMSGRFLVTSLPTIVHAKDGEFRFYTGPRKESDLLSFVDDKKWQDVKPTSSWTHPTSFPMEAVSFFFRFAMKVRRMYNHMNQEYGIPEWAIYIIFAVLTIFVGLFFGLVVVLCCDFLFPPKYIPPHQRLQLSKEQQELIDNDDSDILEDDSPEDMIKQERRNRILEERRLEAEQEKRRQEEEDKEKEEKEKEEEEDESADTVVRRRQTAAKEKEGEKEEAES